MDSRDAIPQSGELMWLVLQAIIGVGGAASVREIETKVIELGGFTTSQQRVLHKLGPGSELSYRQAWARTLSRQREIWW